MEITSSAKNVATINTIVTATDKRTFRLHYQDWRHTVIIEWCNSIVCKAERQSTHAAWPYNQEGHKGKNKCHQVARSVQYVDAFASRFPDHCSQLSIAQWSQHRQDATNGLDQQARLPMFRSTVCSNMKIPKPIMTPAMRDTPPICPTSDFSWSFVRVLAMSIAMSGNSLSNWCSDVLLTLCSIIEHVDWTMSVNNYTSIQPSIQL